MKKVSIFMAIAAAASLASCTAQAPKANLKTDIDSLSYSIGMAQTQGLKGYLTGRLDVDTTYMAEFIKGLNEGANKTKDGVKTTASGLQYKVITEGKGEIPADTCKVKVNYKGTLIDGTEFDSSYKRNEPSTFRANQVIKGWTEALTMMPVGSKWELYIPQELAYGARESGNQIKPFSTLIFEVELLSIEKDKK